MVLQRCVDIFPSCDNQVAIGIRYIPFNKTPDFASGMAESHGVGITGANIRARIENQKTVLKRHGDIRSLIYVWLLWTSKQMMQFQCPSIWRKLDVYIMRAFLKLYITLSSDQGRIAPGKKWAHPMRMTVVFIKTWARNSASRRADRLTHARLQNHLIPAVCVLL